MDYIVGIGACNVDFYIKSLEEAQKSYDHPSVISTSCGGVTRNILENLGNLNVKSYLLSCIGDDKLGEYIVENSSANIDFSHIKIVHNKETSKFIQMLDNHNDMMFAGCDMSILDNLNINYIEENDEIIKNAKAILLDPSLKIEVIKYIIEKYKDKNIFVDTISDHYAEVIRPYINNIFEIKPNIKELEVLSNIKINNEEDLLNACKTLVSNGVKRIVVTMGKNGSFFYSNDNHFIIKLKEVEEMKNASGAGDSFTALLIYSFINNIDDVHALELASAAGILSITSDSVTSKALSVKILEEIIKERRL